MVGRPCPAVGVGFKDCRGQKTDPAADLDAVFSELPENPDLITINFSITTINQGRADDPTCSATSQNDCFILWEAAD